VREVMRPLAVQPLAGAPTAVRGMAVVRGESVPVVDLGALLHGALARTKTHSRWVRLDFGTRRIVLAVDAVLDVRTLSAEALHDAPPLLGEIGDALALRVGTRDRALLLLLGQSHVVPDATLTALDAALPA